MRKIGLVILGVSLAAFLFSFADAADQVAAPSTKLDAGGLNQGWQKPKIGVDVIGVDAEECLDCPQAEPIKGEVSVQAEAIKGKVKTGLAKLETVIKEFISQFNDWLNARPEFKITETDEGGISGYRDEIKNWLDKRPKLDSDAIKEITASF